MIAFLAKEPGATMCLTCLRFSCRTGHEWRGPSHAVLETGQVAVSYTSQVCASVLESS